MEKIAVIYGGKSVEHDISIITALQTMNILSKRYECVPIYIDGQGRWWSGKNLKNIGIYLDFEKRVKGKKQVFADFNKRGFLIGKKFLKPAICFVCCHGLNGEDGTVSGLLELLDIPYSCSGVLSSALSMDKITTKILLEKYDIRNAKFCYFEEADYLNDKSSVLKQINRIGFPLIIKPANLGSSVGISVVRNSEQLDAAIEIGLNFDKKILVEEYLENAREFNCACFTYNGEYFPSNVVEVTKGDIFTFEEKYIENEGKKRGEIERKIIDDVKELTKRVYKLSQCFGIVRIDYLYKDGQIYVNEINNIPGSLASGLYTDNYEEVLGLVIEESLEREKRKQEIKYSFDSDVLKVFERTLSSFKMKK